MWKEEVGSNQDIVAMNMEIMSSSDINGSDSVSGSDFGLPANRLLKARNAKLAAASIVKKARTRRTKLTTCRRRTLISSKSIAMHFRIAYLENRYKRLRACIKFQEAMEKSDEKMEALLHQCTVLLQSINKTMMEIREMLSNMNLQAPVVRAASSDIEAETSSEGDLTEESDNYSEADSEED